jgi:DNA-directed RNA polymerase specialized sigma24 family protein
MGIHKDHDDIVQDVFIWLLTHTENTENHRIRSIVIDVLRLGFRGRKGRTKWNKGFKEPVELDEAHTATPAMSTTLLDFDLIFDKLSEQDQYLLCRQLQGATNIEIAKELNVDPARVVQVLDRLYIRLKKIMSGRRPFKITHKKPNKKPVKLTRSQCRMIRKSTLTYRQLASIYGVAPSTIHNIKKS